MGLRDVRRGQRRLVKKLSVEPTSPVKPKKYSTLAETFSHNFLQEAMNTMSSWGNYFGLYEKVRGQGMNKRMFVVWGQSM